MPIWNFYEKIYDRLWVQIVSLKPTRKRVIEALKPLKLPVQEVLDMSCGTGQLLDDLKHHYPELNLIGVEPSKMNRTARGKGHQVIESKIEAFSTAERFGCICCTHAFPYYTSPQNAMAKFSEHTLTAGYLIIAHAETKSLYDKLALGFVKITTSKAKYPTPLEMARYFEPYYDVCQVVKVNAWFVPSITLYVAKKR